MTLYTATGLDDIAEQFDVLASTSAAVSKCLKVAEKNRLAGGVTAYKNAADILRNTTLTPDPIIAELVAALKASQAALNDWIHTYAGELCDADEVKRSIARIGEYGTLAYIASVQAQNRAVLAKIEGAA